MNSSSIDQDIRYIRSMIDRSREIAAGSWMFFIIWGVLVIVAIAGQYALTAVRLYQAIWLNWVAFAVVGMTLTMIYSRRMQQRSGVRTWLNKAMASVGLAAGVGFLLTGFVYPLLNQYGWAQIPVMMATMAGILVFIMGGLYSWNLLKACGVIWWLGALAMCFVPPQWRSLLFVPLIMVGYLFPALRLRSLYQQQEKGNE